MLKIFGGLFIVFFVFVLYKQEDNAIKSTTKIKTLFIKAVLVNFYVQICEIFILKYFRTDSVFLGLAYI